MMVLTREQILSGCKLETQVVHVDELGGDVTLRAWTGTQRDQWDTFVSGRDKDSFDNVKATAICLSVWDTEAETLMFSPADATQLNESLPDDVIDKLWIATAKMNALPYSDVEELEKNSPADQSDDSGCS